MEPATMVGISPNTPEETSLLHPPFSQLIIAGGDEEIGPSDLIDWVHPVLCGIPAGLWLTCEIAEAGRGCLTARIRNGAQVKHLALCCTIPKRHAVPLCRLLPEVPAAMILLNDHAPQVMALLDGLAGWLNLFEAGDPALAPIVSVLTDYGTPALQRKRAPVSGPF
jgi:hypothetical protein